jgi:hypothetical protein
MVRRCCLVAAAAFGVAGTISFAARAADLPGARLRLDRSPGAEACVAEPALAEELASRMIVSGDDPRGPLILGVDIRRAEDAFEATIRVEGRKEGVRSLRAAGPACDALHDALVVTLLLLLDQDPDRPAALPVAPTPSAPPALPAPPPSAPSETRDRPSLWVSLGGAVSHGLPEGWSGAVMGDASVAWRRWEFGLGAFWAPERTIESPPGSVLVRVFGGRARGCYALGAWPSVRWSGCAMFVVGSLRGQGQGFTNDGSKVQPWFLGGFASEVELVLSPRARLGFFGAALATAHTQSFFVRDLTEPYATDGVVGWLGSEVRVHIW